MHRTVGFFAGLLLLFSLSLFVACSGGGGGGGDDDAASGDDDSGDIGDDDDDTGNNDDDSTSSDTWNDPSSGLTWQVTLSNHYYAWEEAKSYCDNMTLDGSGWHLPTISELRTLIRGCDTTVTGGSCGVTDDCTSDEDCWSDSCVCKLYEGSNNGCYGPLELPDECSRYWSSSPISDYPGLRAWGVNFDNAGVFPDSLDGVRDARCVR